MVLRAGALRQLRLILPGVQDSASSLDPVVMKVTLHAMAYRTQQLEREAAELRVEREQLQRAWLGKGVQQSAWHWLWQRAHCLYMWLCGSWHGS